VLCRLNATIKTAYLVHPKAKAMQRLRFALASLLPSARSPRAVPSMSAFHLSFGGKFVTNILNNRLGSFRHQKFFSTSANSTMPTLSEARDVLNSQGSIRVRKALEVDGRSKMDAKEFLELCRQFFCPHFVCCTNFRVTSVLFSRNGLDEAQAMDLSAALHKVRPTPSNAACSALDFCE
jgi:hypothetical protein